ncbi:MAG: hypothetical protein LBJ39_02405 [Tannerellaceae bacterium]|nr:hypothetical protein [Tannerellaceae bacterium]
MIRETKTPSAFKAAGGEIAEGRARGMRTFAGMKKLPVALMIILGCLSCDGPSDTTNEPGMETRIYTVKQWGLSSGTSFYQCSFSEPALTEFVYNNAIVAAYWVINPDTRNETLQPIPDTWPAAEGPDRWLESVTFDYSPGRVTFYVGYSDFATNVAPPEMTFKLMMIW